MADGVYDHPGVLVTQFTEHELNRVLAVTRGMTPGKYEVARIKPGMTPHLVQVNAGSTIRQPLPKWETIAAVLEWGPRILEDHLLVVDEGQQTGTLHRLANAGVIAWSGNNLGNLLEEAVVMRQMLRQLDLLEVQK